MFQYRYAVWTMSEVFRFCRSLSRLLKCSRCFLSRLPVSSGVGCARVARYGGAPFRAHNGADYRPPQVMESVEVFKVIPLERMSERTAEQITDLPMPQFMESVEVINSFGGTRDCLALVSGAD